VPFPNCKTYLVVLLGLPLKFVFNSFSILNQGVISPSVCVPADIVGTSSLMMCGKQNGFVHV
jgi:hypothetical protein